MDFRAGDEAVSEEGSLFPEEAGTSAASATGAARETGAGPAVAMTDKTDAGSAGLVENLGASALAGAVASVAAARKDDSKSVQPRRFAVITRCSRRRCRG